MSGPAKRPDAADPAGNTSLDRLAHELRTPLAAIQAMAEALGSGHLGPMGNERHAGYVQSIAETARHALAVVEAMLRCGDDMAPVESSPAGLDVAALARDAVAGMSLLAARAGVHLMVEAASGDDPVWARACATDVRQMLINLVSNGIVHAGGGSTVRVATEARDGFVHLRVADNGAGISQEIVDRLAAGAPLDPVADVPAGSRLRLGLTLTRALADANGGRLEITPGTAGTEARVILPAPTPAQACE